MRIVTAAALSRHEQMLGKSLSHLNERRLVVLHSYSDPLASTAIASLRQRKLTQHVDVLTPNDARLDVTFKPHHVRILDQHWKVTLTRLLDSSADVVLLPFNTAGVQWETIFWLSMLPMRRILLFFPGKNDSLWRERTMGVLSHPFVHGSLWRLNRRNGVAAVFGAEDYEVVVEGVLSADHLPLVIALRALHLRGADMPCALRGRLSPVTWRAVAAFTPWDIQQRLLHQLWTEHAVLPEHVQYQKSQWKRVEAALESSASGQPIEDGDELADDLFAKTVELYTIAGNEQTDKQRQYLTNAVEEWRLFVQLLRTRDSQGHPSWGPRPHGDIDQTTSLPPTKAFLFIGKQLLRGFFTRMIDRLSCFVRLR